MNKKLLLAGIAGILSLATACKKDDPTPSPNPPSGLTIDGVASTLEFYQLDTAHLSVAGVAKDAAAKAVWAVNGAKAAEGATFDFTTAHPGKYEVTLTVDGKSAKHTYTVAPRFSEGAFLLNEGNFGNETGSLTYIHPSKKLVIDQAYFHINGTKLGNVCQDLAFGNDQIYIISQNGPKNGGEGLLTIARSNSSRRSRSTTTRLSHSSGLRTSLSCATRSTCAPTAMVSTVARLMAASSPFRVRARPRSCVWHRSVSASSPSPPTIRC